MEAPGAGGSDLRSGGHPTSTAPTEEPPRGARSRLSARLLLAAAALLGSLLLVSAAAELALRLLYGGSAPYFLARIVRFDERLGWRLVPGSAEYFNPSAFTRVAISINELGLRNASVSLRVHPGRQRLTVLGDSFVFSEGLTEGSRFTDELQRRLGPACEVINAGVPGYGTGQEVMFAEELQARGFELGQTVVLVLFANDLSDDAGLAYGSLERDPHKPRFEIRGGRLVGSRPEPWLPVPTELIGQQLARKSLFLGLLRERAENIAAGAPWILSALARAGIRIPLERRPGVIQSWYGPGWRERWALTSEIVRYLANRLRSEGTALVIASLPSPFQVEGVFYALASAHDDDPIQREFLADMDRPQRELLAFCAEEGLLCIDLAPALRVPRSEPAFFLREGHLNSLGSSIVATALHDGLSGRCGASIQPSSPR